MAINWETGEISGEQHIFKDEHVHPLVEQLSDIAVAYVDVSDIGVTPDRRAWVSLLGTAYPEEDVAKVKESLDLCRVIKTPKGFILDVSAGDFTLTEEPDEFKFAPDRLIDIESDEWEPVIGLITTDEERTKIEGILFDQFSFMVGTSVLELLAREDE